MAPQASGWFRRRTPRLFGTLHIREANGHELVIPLRGRASLLTAGGTGLRGHGEVWAVHTTAPTAETSLMIVYGREESAENLESGLCAAGQTVVLGEVSFTWRAPSTPLSNIPRPRPAATDLPRNLRVPTARPANARPEPIPANIRPEPIPANIRPEPVSTNIRPEPVSTNIRPEPVSTNARPEPVSTNGLRGRLRNMVRVVTQATRH